jgi:hypothetical protein
MYGLPVGASEEGELHFVIDENVSKPIHCDVPSPRAGQQGVT